MTILARGKCWSFSSRGYPFPRQSFLDGAREYLDGALKCRNNNNPDVPPPDFINLYYVATYLAPIYNFVIDPSELIIVGKYLRIEHILGTFFFRASDFLLLFQNMLPHLRIWRSPLIFHPAAACKLSSVILARQLLTQQDHQGGQGHGAL